MKRNVVLSVIVVLTVCACGAKPGEIVVNSYDDVPKGWQVFVTPGNYRTYVVPTTVDGAHCVITMTQGHGTGIACDFREPR